MQPFLSLVLPGKPRYNKGSIRPVHGKDAGAVLLCIMAVFLPKCPYIYYLENIKCRYKASYAASAYGMSYERKTSNQLAHISELLEDFDLIACRDEYTENQVRKISRKTVYHACDPTFFLNASDFDEYAKWLFEILFELEKDIQSDVEARNDYQN